MLLAACGDDGGTAADSGGGPCWPLEASPGGEVELGTGEIDFEALGSTIIIVRNASQSDPFMQLHSRIRGMPAGDPNDPFDPRNPKTKVAVVIDELSLTLGVECPASLGYVASPEAGAYDMVHSLRIGFGIFPTDQAVGKQARITIEVVGSNRLYAKDERTVTLTAP